MNLFKHKLFLQMPCFEIIRNFPSGKRIHHFKASKTSLSGLIPRWRGPSGLKILHNLCFNKFVWSFSSCCACDLALLLSTQRPWHGKSLHYFPLKYPSLSLSNFVEWRNHELDKKGSVRALGGQKDQTLSKVTRPMMCRYAVRIDKSSKITVSLFSKAAWSITNSGSFWSVH